MTGCKNRRSPKIEGEKNIADPRYYRRAKCGEMEICQNRCSGVPKNRSCGRAPNCERVTIIIIIVIITIIIIVIMLR